VYNIFYSLKNLTGWGWNKAPQRDYGNDYAKARLVAFQGTIGKEGHQTAHVAPAMQWEEV
jgi:hypothetical protein